MELCCCHTNVCGTINTTKQVFGDNGITERVISDNSLHYNSAAYKQFAKEWRFEHLTSFTRYKQFNGLAVDEICHKKSKIEQL